MTPPKAQPYFSILIPSYNRPEDIKRNIDSILLDSFKDIEIIISDDHSPRQTEISEIITPYLKLENIHYYPQPENLREPQNKNFLVSKANGKYNIILGDDDRFCPNALSTLKNHIEENPDFDFYGVGYHVVDEHDRIIVSHRTRKPFEISNNYPYAIKEVFNADILPLWLFHPATFCCRQGIELNLPYKTDVGMAEDMWFLFEFLFHSHKMLIIPEFTFYWQKIQNLDTDKQINQSLLHLANFNARKLMYEKLLGRAMQDRSEFLTYLSSIEYRIRFLYDPLISGHSFNKVEFDKLDLCQEYKSELFHYTKRKKIWLLKYKNYFKRSYHFMGLVGWLNGMETIFRILLQRIFYKMRPRLEYKIPPCTSSVEKID